jgi:hypothetical protein
LDALGSGVSFAAELSKLTFFLREESEESCDLDSDGGLNKSMRKLLSMLSLRMLPVAKNLLDALPGTGRSKLSPSRGVELSPRKFCMLMLLASLLLRLLPMLPLGFKRLLAPGVRLLEKDELGVAYEYVPPRLKEPRGV